MTHKALFFIAALLSGTQAQALACRTGDIATSYQEAKASPLTHWVLRGTFAFDDALMNRRAFDTSPAPKIPAFFRGQILTNEGFTQSFESPVFITQGCASEGCGTIRSGAPVTAFVAVSGSTLNLNIGLCRTMVLPPADAEMERRLLSCLHGGPCQRPPVAHDTNGRQSAGWQSAND